LRLPIKATCAINIDAKVVDNDIIYGRDLGAVPSGSTKIPVLSTYIVELIFWWARNRIDLRVKVRVDQGIMITANDNFAFETRLAA